MKRFVSTPAARIALLYLGVGILWILLSDTVIHITFNQSPQVLMQIQTIKGWLFVFLTAGGLYVLMRREFEARRRSERKALERETLFHNIFAFNPLPMLVYDRETLRYIDVNEAACSHYGYSREEFLRLSVSDIRPEEDVPRLLQYIADHNEGFRDAGEWRHKTKDGQTIAVAISALALSYAGRPAVLTVVRDLTEQKRSELERIENEKLRLILSKEGELHAIRGRFTSMVSHEFRRPLTTITTAIELLEHYRDRMNEETIQKHFSRLHEQLDEMKELLDDFLALMRAETASRELKLTRVNLNALCEKLVEELRPTAGVDHPIMVMSTCSVVMEGDEKLLRQAISNLLTNAIKYSPKGGEVRVQICHNQDIEIHVIDHGIGIPPQELPRLFEPFYRASNVGDLTGTGLGLPIAKQAAELHGGTLQVVRTGVTGTEFLLTLPKSESVVLTGC